MRITIVAAALLSLMPVAHAEWLKVFENIRGTTSYIDTDSIQASGRYRKVSELQSYKKASPEGMLSMRIRKEYDCKEELTRMITYTAYTGKMGSGEAMGTVNPPTDWQSVSQNPGAKGAFRHVCGE
jgi:hypothetical protein